MSLYSYKDFSPKLGDGVYIAPSADVIGRVFLEDNANLWHQVVARGDVNDIRIGAGTNIQDLSMLHVVEEIPLIIGKGVSVGHGAIIHACTIGDHCLIGMGSIILDGAVIGDHCVVAAGSVVAPGKKYPPNSMIMGSPAKVVRQLSEKEYEGYGNHYKSYLKYKDEFLDDSIVKLID
tara:strand:- start:1319 stop:1849 length:531 start_codon:yes stop_codon:yes gene_type:complete